MYGLTLSIVGIFDFTKINGTISTKPPIKIATVVNIVNNTAFKRDGDNLYLTVELDLYKAILGGDIIINTIDGKKLKLKVQPETQNETKVKLKGKGVPIYKKGDQNR